MSETKKLQLARVVLSSGRAVYLREARISHTENAAQKVAAKSNGDANVLQFLMQKALVQQLLCKIAPTREAEPKALSAQELEDLDGILSIGEYTEVLQVVGEMTGAGGKTKPRIEMVAE